MFEGKPWDVLELEELIKIMMAWWVKSRWPNDSLSIMEIARSPLTASAHIKRAQAKANVSGSAHLGDGLNSIRMRLGQLRVVGDKWELVAFYVMKKELLRWFSQNVLAGMILT